MRNWTQDAACKGILTEMFFTERGQGDSSDLKMILKMCKQCPVRTDCLEEALSIEAAYGTRHGIWGGKTPNERHAIYRERVMDETGLCYRKKHVMDERNTGYRNGRDGKPWRFCRACQEHRHGDGYYSRAS